MKLIKKLVLPICCVAMLSTNAYALTGFLGTGEVELSHDENSVGANIYNVPKIYFNGELYTFPNEYRAIMKNQRVLVPIKSGIFNEVGATATYDIINREITIKNKSHLISTYLQELDWYDGGIRRYISDVRSDQIGEDVYISLRVALECLGYTVDYQSNNGDPKVFIY